jgi:acetate kinase
LGTVIVLTFNSGSSSLKFGLYRVEGTDLDMLMTGESDGGNLHAEDVRGAPLPGTPLPVETNEAAIGAIVSLLADAKLPTPDAIGHRVVHGGIKLRAHCLIDAGIEHDLEAASALSPLHAPAALAIIRMARAAWPGLPQVACLDTAFHANMPEIARVLPVSKKLHAEGVQRYGFHGLSCESIVRQFGADVPHRLIIAHLGSGASVTAVRDGASVDTSMGLTPSGGIVMATRSGDLDPGLLIYLLREKGYDATALEDLVDHRSGLKGISGSSGDLRELHESEGSSADAELAIAMFCMSVAKAIAGMIVVLEGVDTIVFTGGIGEHDAKVRTTICGRLGALGVHLDDGLNGSGRGRLSLPGTGLELLALPSQEDEQIALHVSRLVARESSDISGDRSPVDRPIHTARRS